MSRKDLEGFYRKIAGDDNLKIKVQALKGDQAYADFVKLAKEAGFEVTVEDVKASQAERQDMSDGELQKVSGGGSGVSDCHRSCGPACGDYGGTWMGMQ